MTDTGGRPLDWLREPAYTGANRCLPCTVVNVCLAGVASAVVATLSVPGAVALMAVALFVIYLRGYLVPGTPALTKRYLPDRVLAYFDKRPSVPVEDAADGSVDIEETLASMGVVTECADVDDLCLAPAFRRIWHRHAAALEVTDDRDEVVASLLDVAPDRLSVTEYGSATVVRVDGQQVGTWESHAALLADLATDRALAEWSRDWAGVDAMTRGRILNSLRMFLDTCPACGGAVTLGQETVESCCRAVDVAAVTCEECESRLFEVELPSSPAGA